MLRYLSLFLAISSHLWLFGVTVDGSREAILQVTQLARQVKENAMPGIVIATVFVRTGRDEFFSCRLKGEMSSLFRLRHQNRQFYLVKLTGHLDYEKTKSIEITVICRGLRQDPLATISKKIKIEILDVNDNPPRISEKRLIKTLREESQVGQKVSLITVFDPESGNQGRVSCRMTTLPEDVFMLRQINRTTYLVLTSRSVDREVTAVVRYDIICQDEGSPPLTATWGRRIDIQDIDDNAPVFPQKIYSLAVPENNPIGIRILKVRAVDRDSGSRIRYKLIPSHQFSINASTGIIQVNAALDREAKKKYSLKVLAISSSVGSKFTRTASAEIKVTVLDKNDNIPVFPLKYYVFVAKKNKTRVGILRAMDNDEGDNAVIRYKMRPFIHGIRIDEKTGEISRNISFKFSANALNFTVLAVNGKLTGKATVTIILPEYKKVTHIPEKISRNISLAFHYWFNVDENQPVGTRVGRVAVSGAENVRFSLRGKNVKGLKIDRVSGVLSTTTVFDRESMKDINASIIASHAPTRKVLSTKLYVAINDVNDCTPEFEKNITISIPEGGHRSIEIPGTLATDCDVTSPNNKISYKIFPKQYAKYFELYKNGSLWLKKGDFDRESVSAIKVTLKATDGGSPSLSSSLFITIKITDINDNAPVWFYPFSNNTKMYFPINLPVGGVVVMVRAIDKDLGKNGTVVYRLPEKGNIKNLPFSLNRRNGLLTLIRALNKTEPKIYVILLEAKDLGNPPKKSYSKLKLEFIKT